MLQLQIQGQTWLLLGNLKPNEQKEANRHLPRVQVLWWSGESLATDLLAAKPEVVIASAATLDPDTLSRLQRQDSSVLTMVRSNGRPAVSLRRKKQRKTMPLCCEKLANQV